MFFLIKTNLRILYKRLKIFNYRYKILRACARKLYLFNNKQFFFINLL